MATAVSASLPGLWVISKFCGTSLDMAFGPGAGGSALADSAIWVQTSRSTATVFIVGRMLSRPGAGLQDISEPAKKSDGTKGARGEPKTIFQPIAFDQMVRRPPDG